MEALKKKNMSEQSATLLLLYCILKLKNKVFAVKYSLIKALLFKSGINTKYFSKKIITKRW